MNILFSYIKHYKKIILAALFLTAINNFFSLLDPYIFRLIVDNYAAKINVLPRPEFFRGVILLLFASVGVAFVSRLAKNFQDYFVNIISQRAGAKLYGDSISHSFSLSYSVFEDQRSGEHLQKLQKARTDSQILIAGFFNVVFFSFVGVIFVLVYSFFIHWTIGFLFFLLVPAVGLTTFAISKKIKAVQKIIIKQSAELAGSTTETLRNVELVKSLGLENQEINRLNNVNEKILGLELKKIRHVRILSFIQGTLVNGMRALLVFLMLWLIFNRFITIGEFFSLFVYSFFVFGPLQEFGSVITQYQEAKASMEQLEKILLIPVEPKPVSSQKVKSIESIIFKDVHFIYPSADFTSLSDVNLEIKAGQVTAFVGPSGSGKSTIVKLISGLYKPTKGDLLFNSVSVKEIDYDYLRKKIGLVSQETQLFSGTVRENLIFVNPDARDKECLEALSLASVTGIIERGSKGLDTKIGEGGIKISGGERQRLAIARALLRKPDLIIFDEATSSLDSLTEKEITKTIREIEKARPNLITILVAHRLSTVSHADKIYVLEQGRIIEQGSHQNLLSQGNLYFALWREQIGKTEKVLI